MRISLKDKRTRIWLGRGRGSHTCNRTDGNAAPQRFARTGCKEKYLSNSSGILPLYSCLKRKHDA